MIPTMTVHPTFRIDKIIGVQCFLLGNDKDYTISKQGVFVDRQDGRVREVYKVLQFCSGLLEFQDLLPSSRMEHTNAKNHNYLAKYDITFVCCGMPGSWGLRISTNQLPQQGLGCFLKYQAGQRQYIVACQAHPVLVFCLYF